MQTDLHPLRNVIAQANPSEQHSSPSDGTQILIAAHIQKAGAQDSGSYLRIRLLNLLAASG